MISKIIENLRMATDALLSNRMRSILTMLGITIGVASVILLMSVGQAVEKFVLKEFSSFGSNLVVVIGTTSNEVFDEFNAEEFELFIPLTWDDYLTLSNPNNVSDATVVAADVGVAERVYYNGEYYDPQVVGITANYLEAYDFQLGYGEWMTEAEVESAARLAYLGQDVVEDLFGNENPLGKVIRIGEVNFEVAGVAAPIESALNPEADNLVIVPITTAQRRLIGERTVDGDYPVTSISIKAQDESVVDEVVKQVRDSMRRSHNLAADERDDFVIFSQNQLLDTLGTVTSLLTLFLGVIAGISLLVGGIGIMNIMLVTVTERTKEIGLRKAIGAQRADILTQFLVESVTLSVIGGTIGTLIAISASVLATVMISDLDVSVQMSSILLAVIISLSVGTFFGAYPANRAAALNPIDALRYE